MMPATKPRADRDATRLLVIDPRSRQLQGAAIADLPRYLRAGDLLILNDAATLPGSLPATTARGEPIELRLSGPARDDRFTVVVFGAGDYHTRTEDRVIGGELGAAANEQRSSQLRAHVVGVSGVSSRLIDVRFDRAGSELWSALYARGVPVQYAYQTVQLPLWSVQTAYASRPWAAEMPSAGRPLSFATLQAVRRAGVELASLTHAAGLSATGDPELDAALPLPEQYELPARTVDAIERTRRLGGRVIAVGTTVVRALEGAAANSGRLVPGSGVTDLRLGPMSRLQIVSGILTGMHSPAESHYALLAAFVPEESLLRQAFEHAEHHHFLAHEFGDSTLILTDTVNHLRHAA
jgi:S-adenosylmethionine:tRNA ribosyltransferase-isomerase